MTLLNKLNEDQRRDTCYKAACYLLDSDPYIQRTAAPFVSHDGIDFSKLRRKPMQYDYQKILIEIAYSLFSYKCGKVSPYEMSNLPGNYLDCAINAILIKAGRGEEGWC